MTQRAAASLIAVSTTQPLASPGVLRSALPTLVAAAEPHAAVEVAAAELPPPPSQPSQPSLPPAPTEPPSIMERMFSTIAASGIVNARFPAVGRRSRKIKAAVLIASGGLGGGDTADDATAGADGLYNASLVEEAGELMSGHVSHGADGVDVLDLPQALAAVHAALQDADAEAEVHVPAPHVAAAPVVVVAPTVPAPAALLPQSPPIVPATTPSALATALKTVTAMSKSALARAAGAMPAPSLSATAAAAAAAAAAMQPGARRTGGQRADSTGTIGCDTFDAGMLWDNA